MAGNLSQKSRSLLGLDISSSAIKLVELSASGRDGYRVDRYVIEVLPRDAVVEGNIANPEAVQNAIRIALKRLGSSRKQVAIALPTSAVISKKISVPSGLRDDELEDLVQSEASQHIPFAIDEVRLDFRVVGTAASGGEDEVLIVATKQDRVDDRVAVVEAVGLEAVMVDVDSYATLAASERIVSQLGGGLSSITAFVDVGMNALRFSVLKGSTPIFSREQVFGGHQLTQDVARRFNIGYAEAETGKRNGSLPEEYALDLLPQFVESLALEVARSLQFFFTTTQFSKVDRIVLSGGCAAIAGVADTVAGRTQVDTVIANPFAGMTVADRIRNTLQKDAPLLLGACGLALRGYEESGQVSVNLLPYRDAEAQARKRDFTLSAGVAALAGLLIVGVGWFINDSALEDQRAASLFVQSEIGNAEQAKKEIQELQAKISALLARKAAIETLQKDRGNIVHIFNELLVRIPDGIYLLSLKQNGQDVTVTGLTQSQSRVSELMRNIAASPWMDNPKLNEIKAEAAGGRRQHRFSLMFSITTADETAEGGNPGGAKQ